MDIQFLESLRYKESEGYVTNPQFDYKNYCMHLRRLVKTLFPINQVPGNIVDDIDEFEQHCEEGYDFLNRIFDSLVDQVKSLDEIE